MFPIRWIIFLLFLAATPTLASPTQQEERFDRPLNTRIIPLPSDPLNPQAKASLSCFYYPHFMVKQIDLGEKGAAQLSILPVPPNQDNTPCRQPNAPDEKVVSGDSRDSWSGYFRGVKGPYVFFDSDDSWEEGIGFAIYNGLNGEKIFSDAVNGSIRTLRANKTLLKLTYKRVYRAPCSMQADPTGCAQKIQQETGLTTLAPTLCVKAYDALLKAELKRRMGVSEQKIRKDSLEDLSVLNYAVTVRIENGTKSITPQSGPIECYTAE